MRGGWAGKHKSGGEKNFNFSGGGAGIPFPQTPFPSRPADAVVIRDFQNRFALSLVYPTRCNFASFVMSSAARFARGWLKFFLDFPIKFAKRQTNPKRFFCPASGGSALRSNAQNENFVSNFFLSAEGGIRIQFLFSVL